MILCQTPKKLNDNGLTNHTKGYHPGDSDYFGYDNYCMDGDHLRIGDRPKDADRPKDGIFTFM